jgi:hypothetical protein
MLTDARGCLTSTPSSASLQQYEQALDLSLSYELDPLATIQKALDADPTFAMGHCLRAGLWRPKGAGPFPSNTGPAPRFLCQPPQSHNSLQ